MDDIDRQEILIGYKISLYSITSSYRESEFNAVFIFTMLNLE